MIMNTLANLPTIWWYSEYHAAVSTSLSWVFVWLKYLVIDLELSSSITSDIPVHVYYTHSHQYVHFWNCCHQCPLFWLSLVFVDIDSKPTSSNLWFHWTMKEWVNLYSLVYIRITLYSLPLLITGMHLPYFGESMTNYIAWIFKVV